MKQVLQAILSGSASPDDYANLALPDGYRGVTVHKDEVHMFEVWDSPDQFDAHSDRLFAVIQGAGVDAGTVNVHPLHSPHPD